MGFFDKLFSKGPVEKPAGSTSTDLPRAELAAAVEHLAGGRTSEAVAIHESLVAANPDSGELLAAISADLGRQGCLSEMLALLTPAYDAGTHGPQTGINLIQAYLKLGQPDGAQMMIDVVSALDRPDLADRLGGFAHAVEELRSMTPVEAAPAAAPREEPSINLVSISKPVWSYALPDGDSLLPKKEGRLRRVAILPLGAADAAGVALDPGHPANVWARSFPLAIAEALSFAPGWQPKAVVAVAPGDKLFTPPRGFGVEQARDLFGGGNDAADYAITGLLVVADSQLKVRLEVIDVRKNRSIKTMTDSCPAARPDMALHAVLLHLRQYMEATETLPCAIDYQPPAGVTAHLIALDHALAFFLVDKKVVAREFLGDAGARVAALDAHASSAKGPLAPLLARAARAGVSNLQST